MTQVSLQDKNAYLSVYISHSQIHSVLAYSHNEIDRQYLLEDRTAIDYQRDDLSSVLFWEELFSGLTQQFGWEFLSGLGNGASFREVIPFEDEGSGVVRMKVLLWNNTPNVTEVLQSIRAISPQIEIEMLDGKKFGSKSQNVGAKIGYLDVISLELDPTRFSVARTYKSGNKKNFKNIKASDWESHEAKISWDNKYALIDSVRSSKFKAFLGDDKPFNVLVNTWANFILTPTVERSNESLKDLVRSYITVQLFSIYNDNKEMFAGYGVSGKKSCVIVSGLLASVLDENELLIGILDGLQMRGNFDLYVDKGSHLLTLGDQYSLGVNADKYIVQEGLMDYVGAKVYIPEVPGKEGEVKMVFDGELIRSDQSREPIHTVTPHLSYFELDSSLKNILSGKFVKGSYVEGLNEDIELIAGKDGDNVDRVYIDSRFKPSIYGPTASDNRSKIKAWLAKQ